MERRGVRTIGVVTVARSDYGIYLPILQQLRDDAELGLHLYVTGMHLSGTFGLTVRQIEADGFATGDRIEMLEESDAPESIARSIGRGVAGFADAFAAYRPDILLVLGDRFEMFCPVVAALPFNIPIAHIHGGESTEGAMDESIRHAITKMSHLHFAATEAYAKRLAQMGEQSWRITVSGAPALDHLGRLTLPDRAQLAEQTGIDLGDPYLLVTYHPVTLEHEHTEHQITELLAVLDELAMPVVFTYPNADTSGRIIIDRIEAYAQDRSDAHVATSFDPATYLSLMRHAAAMVGNSSAGIIEAASFKLPVVNIGSRQRGRIRSGNVIDAGYGRDAILDAVRRALDDDFRGSLNDLTNPYGDGRAAERIIDKLKSVELNQELLQKRFCDL